MSPAAEFVDAALQHESTWERAEADRYRIGAGGDIGLEFYGASVGAIRAAIRSLGQKFPDPTHDEITVLASELWAPPVFERRLAAIVLLQTHVGMLRHGDLTRLEGFLRQASVLELWHPLAVEVVVPLVNALDPAGRRRADTVLARWADDGDAGFRLAVQLLSG